MNEQSIVFLTILIFVVFICVLLFILIRHQIREIQELKKEYYENAMNKKSHFLNK